MTFILSHADAVNLSFVNDVQDVADLQELINSHERDNLGVVLKIETQRGFQNLPAILLKAMESYPVGVMIARGDLAVECGWENLADTQEEILKMCRAARMPNIWATQVLETMAKTGRPTRAEITDASEAQRADCIMLNKGPYIAETVKMLDIIIRKAEAKREKHRAILQKSIVHIKPNSNHAKKEK
jgi:pyruvate kinase